MVHEYFDAGPAGPRWGLPEGGRCVRPMGDGPGHQRTDARRAQELPSLYRSSRESGLGGIGAESWSGGMVAWSSLVRYYVNVVQCCI